MPGANQQPNPSLTIRDEFEALLESQWTRQVACQDECRPTDACSCQREIVHVHALEAWWKKQASEGPHTKLERFLHETPLSAHRSLPVRATRISRAGESCLRILSLLLKQRRDHLIDRFYEANMYDNYLPLSENDQNLREQLTGVVHHEEVETIIDDFHKEKWKYCPLPLALDMDRNLYGTRTIPPFCLKIKLPEKGGTASIYWVAVQKDLISDNALALALQDSLYTDEEYGECYQMVLKSYCGNKKRDFELEKEAFSGLQSSDEVPILRYLGSYTHEYGEGKGLGKTYNLLLEYGENDLYQAWADETNVPPVQAQEILQSWKSLFRVAEAIRHVHHLEILRGKDRPWRFHGWHADIKPDNILSVRGRLKLADFGFSSFAPVVDGHEGSEPMELIRGTTKTYGAPEVSRMKQPDGTLSGVSQSIDAWSFGCVLSVAATWFVLGFQGVRQYERLRQLSPANKVDGQDLDCFHDGYHVLPEVQSWHNYLRGHLRPSDTTTEMVLTLIENKLLRAEPVARHTVEELCEKLQELSDWAEYKIKTLRKYSRDTDPLVMRALSSIEEEAQIQRFSEPKVNLLQQPLLPVNPRERASMAINKEEMIRQKPLGQTAHRKQILDEKLEVCYGRQAHDEAPLVNGVHNGAVTDSPTASTPPKAPDFSGRQNKPRNPQFQLPDSGRLDSGPKTPYGGPSRTRHDHPATPPSSNRQYRFADVGNSQHDDDSLVSNSHDIPVDVSSHVDSNLGRPTLKISTVESPSTRYSTTPALSKFNPYLLSSPTEGENKRQNFDPTTEKEMCATKSPELASVESGIERDIENKLTVSIRSPVDRQSQKGKAPVIFDTSPTSSAIDQRRVYELNEERQNRAEVVGRSGPSITLSQLIGDQSPQHQPETPDVTTQGHEKQFLRTHASATSQDDLPRPLPLSALDLPYDICLKRKEMDQQVSKGLTKGIAKVKGNLGIETRPRAASLVETFSDPREIILVVDNGWTMSKHWPITTFVTQTLAKNAAGLDKSGFDVKFTVDGHTHNEERLKGDSGRRKLKRALRAAWPEYQSNDHATTDMAKVFANIFGEWNRSNRPATTLLVLTDGVWSKTDLNTLNETILGIARSDKRHAGSRHFSIQFIRFGDGALERARLQWLDDHLCAENNLRDIIDHCSWRCEVDKMFKGSIEGYLDEQDSVEQPMLYDYEKLVALFNAFSGGRDSTLSPNGALFRSSSRGSNRSSFSMPHGDVSGDKR